MRLDLLLKEIKDDISRENFERIQELFDKLQILDGEWYFFDVDLPNAGTNKIKHNQTFVPKDIILLNIQGDHGVYFKYQSFDGDFIHVVTRGPCRIRFLAGAFGGKAYGQAAGQTRVANYPFIPQALTKQTTVDFGATPVAAKLFTVTDSDVTTNSKIMAQVGYVATTQDADEAELTPLNLICQPGDGTFTIYANTSEGRAYGEFAINYQVG